MDLFQRVLVHMSRWSRKRPSRALIVTVCAALALIAVLAGIERFIGWPEALSVNRLPRTPTIAR